MRSLYSGELVVECKLIREKETEPSDPIRTPKDIHKLMAEYLTNSPQEQMWVLILNARNQVIGMNMVALGTANASLVHPRETFRAAILMNGVSIILVHNHPSGDPEPSNDDRELTQRMIKAGELMGIDVLDHVIVAGEKLYSFKEHESF